MSKRYIDAYALENRVEDFEKLTGMKLDIVHDFISSEPTADVVEVVRCRDCRYYGEFSMKCNKYHFVPIEGNGYCHGEKKEA